MCCQHETGLTNPVPLSLIEATPARVSPITEIFATLEALQPDVLLMDSRHRLASMTEIDQYALP